MRTDEEVLVIAPDPQLRRSICFLLEAEGIAVTACGDLSELEGKDPSKRRCMVVDEGAACCLETLQRLGRMADTVVLLLNRARRLPTGIRVKAIEKPHLGSELASVVAAALMKVPTSFS